MGECSLLEAIQQAMDEEMTADERVIIIGEDVGLRGGVFRATQGLLEKYGSNRVIDAPLAVGSTIGVGIGLALYGLHPVCEVQSADFLHPALNQIINEAAKMCYRSKGDWLVPLVIRAPYGGGVGGGLYHSQSVEAFFAHVPGIKVVIPSNPYDAKGLLKSALRDLNPVVFLEPKNGYQTLRGEVPDDDYSIPLGTSIVTRQGRDITVIAYGMVHHYALQAAGKVAGEGIDVEVVDLRTLYPLDKKTILASVRKTNRALIVYEDNLTGGYGAEVAAILAEEAFTDLDAPVRRLAGPDVPAMPFSKTMESWFMVSPRKIEDEIRRLIAY
jgi:2-oxoisovalerate dehydrogenase E1 component beta subunit